MQPTIAFRCLMARDFLLRRGERMVMDCSRGERMVMDYSRGERMVMDCSRFSCHNTAVHFHCPKTFTTSLPLRVGFSGSGLHQRHRVNPNYSKHIIGFLSDSQPRPSQRPGSIPNGFSLFSTSPGSDVVGKNQGTQPREKATVVKEGDPEEQVEGDPEEQVVDTKILRTLVKYLWMKDDPGVRLRVIAALGLLVGAKVLHIQVLFLFKIAVDWLTAATGNASALASFTSANSTAVALFIDPEFLVCGYMIARILASGFYEWQTVLFSEVGLRTTRSVTRKVFVHLHKLNLSYHLSRETGALNRIIDRGSRAINFILSSMVLNVVPTVLEICMVSGILAYKYGAKFGAIFALFPYLSVALHVKATLDLTQWRTKVRKAMNKADNEASTRVVDSLINYETVKYFNNEAYEVQKYDELLKSYEDAALKLQHSLSSLNFLHTLICSSALLVAMGSCCHWIMKGQMTVGDLVKPEIRDEPDAKPLELKGGEIKFDNVHFRKILDGISFAVPAGKSVAIVGTSGSGKSTILRLMFRFFDAQIMLLIFFVLCYILSAEISIDGQLIRKVTLESFRKSIGIVPQDSILFNDTIFHNIHYGRLSATEEEVYDAARRAAIHDTIMNFPENYSTVVGERGLKLSGGENQRVALARAFLKAPSILLCDEATSELDSTTEAEILNDLKSLSDNRTLVFVAHRLTTAMQCDEIIVLENGKVVEQGPHEILLSKAGRYAQLWEQQNNAPDGVDIVIKI